MTHSTASAHGAAHSISLLLLLVVALATLGGTAGAARAVAPGLADDRLDGRTQSRSAFRAALDDATLLHAGWVRLNLGWDTLEPRRGAIDQHVLAGLDTRVDALHAAGLQILLTVQRTPRWASARRWWRHPVPGTGRGYRPYYVPASSSLPELRHVAAVLAERYDGRVDALECWNEPNFWWFLYPQRTASDAAFGAHTYLRMLQAFSAGVRETGSSVAIIAGATMSVGTNDRYRTSPLRFARYLKGHGATALFDGYSHHPYTPGGSRGTAPGCIPARPATTVTLGNIGALLRVFPDKPFYLTEYGYNTRPSRDFGYQYVSETMQARYLKAAYTVAARHPQIKALFWYLSRDVRPAHGPASAGVYTGLRRPNGTCKPSWNAFRRLQ